MLVRYYSVHLVAYNTMVKTKLKVYCKYKHLQI
jgi:hypothetical protein